MCLNAKAKVSEMVSTENEVTMNGNVDHVTYDVRIHGDGLSSAKSFDFGGFNIELFVFPTYTSLEHFHI